MDVLIVIGGGIVGVGLGGVVGVWLGSVTDHSDFPIAPVIYGPMGAAIGAVVGAATATAIFG